MNCSRRLKRGIIGGMGSILLIALDQYTKFLAVKYLRNQPNIVFWKGVFELQYLENRGAAFGIMQGQKLFFVIFTSIAMIGIVWFFIKKIPEAPKYRFLSAQSFEKTITSLNALFLLLLIMFTHKSFTNYKIAKSRITASFDALIIAANALSKSLFRTKISSMLIVHLDEDVLPDSPP